MFLSGPGWYSDSSKYRQFYIPTVLYSDSSIFRQFYIPTVLYSDRSIFRQLHAVTRVNIPTARCSEKLYIKIRVDIPTVPCSDKNQHIIKVDIPTVRGAEDKVKITRGRYSGSSMLRKVINVKSGQFSERSIFRQFYIPIILKIPTQSYLKEQSEYVLDDEQTQP